jgi:hypothetical protein
MSLEGMEAVVPVLPGLDPPLPRLALWWLP